MTTDPRLDYDMTRALNPQRDTFPVKDGRQIFYKITRDREYPIIIPERLKDPLNDIGEEFFYGTGVPVTVTSGFRKPAEQARLMYDAFHRRQDAYRRGQPADELRLAFAHGRRRGEPPVVTERFMAEIIARQVARGLFVSSHLRNNGLDFSDRDMSEHRGLLQKIVKKHGHSPLFHDGHLHTTFRLRK